MSNPVCGPEHLQSTLILVLDHAMPVCEAVAWRLVGTGASLLHGVDLPVGDIDILVREREGVERFGAALSPFPCLQPPVYIEMARQYYANYEVNGVEVGISTVEWEAKTDGLECVGVGPWEHFSLIPCGSYMIPTVNLELRLMSELTRDRPDRFEPLIAYLQAHRCDTDLIRRGLEDRGFSSEKQNEILNRLYEKGMPKGSALK